MLNNYADSGGGFNSNHGQTARPTETQKQQNLGTSWSYNSQLEGIYYGSEPQPMYMGPYEGSAKHANYPQYPSGTLHQPVPTPVVQCHDTCCQHYENRYPINPAPLRYQPNGPLQPRYADIPNSDSRQYFPDRRPVQVNLPRKKAYPAENGYTGISDRHYSQYMGRGQTLPVDSRQQMQVMRPQYPAYPHYWGGSRGWAGTRMNCPPPSYHQSVNQSAQLQPGAKLTDSSQYMDPTLQKSLSAQLQRGVGPSSGKLDIVRPVAEQKRPTDPSLQSCYDYGYQTGFLPFSEVNKMQAKSLNSHMNVSCKIPAEKQYHPQQMQYPYQNSERNLISYGNPNNDPGYAMSFPLSSGDIHTRPDLDEGQQGSGARKLSMHYDSSGKKRQDLDLRQYLSTWDDDEDESARLSEPPLPVGSTATPYIVVECSTLESEAAAKLQERFKPLASSQDCSTKPRGSSPSSEHKRSNEPLRQEDRTERTITHSDLHSHTSYAPSMPTLLSDSDKNVNFWNGLNKETDSIIGKGGAFQPLDCSKRDSNINPKVVSQRDSLPSRDAPGHKALCSSDPSSSFDALVSFYGDSRRVSGGYDLVEMSERLMNSSDKTRVDQQPSAELARPCDPRLQQSQLSNNPSMYDKLSPRFSTNNYQHFKGVPTDTYYNYKHPMSSSEKYYGYENTSMINSSYDYNKFMSEFDSTRLYGNKEAQKDSRRVLFPDSQKNPENTLIEPLPKSSMPNCFQDKTTLEYTALEPDQFMSPIIDKSTENLIEPCSRKSNTIEDRLNQQKTSLSSAGIESQVQSEKTVLVTSHNTPPEILRMSYSPKIEISPKDNIVTLHSGDQTKNNTITVEVPYVQQYSTLVKLSEEISRTDEISVGENVERAIGLTQVDKTTEETKKPTCFKLKRLPNSKEWAVEGNGSTESAGKDSISSPTSPEATEDSDILKTSVSVSNLNMPSLDDIRDGEENCDVVRPMENHSKKLSEGVLCSNKTSAQPPQLAIVQPMKLGPCKGELPEPSLQHELNNEENKTKQALKAFRSFHSHNNLNGTSFSNDKPVTVTNCDSQECIKTDISKHENFRSHKKIQGDFSNTFPNCLSSPNEEFSHSQEANSETTKQQYSPFHMYSDCGVNSRIPDFFKMDQRPSSEKILDKQVPTSPGVEGMFEDINHSTNNQLCHSQIYQRKTCNFQDLSGPSMSSFDSHNSHFQSFSSMFADGSNNKGRCDGSVLQMGDKKYLKHLLDDFERQQVSNTLEERVSELKSNFMNETSNDNKACEAKKSPPIPPINLKLSESKKIWCITNKDQHLSLSDFSDNSSHSLTSKSTTEKRTTLMPNKSDQDKYFMEIPSDETNQPCYRNDDILLSADKNFSDFDNCEKMDREPILNQLSSEMINKVCYSPENTFTLKNIDTTLAQIPSGIDLPNKPISESTSDFSDATKICPLDPKIKKENHCLAIVKYYPRCEILKGSLFCDIDGDISHGTLIFDEKGTHFPQENDKDNQEVESKSIAKDIVEILITNVIFSREVVDGLENESVIDTKSEKVNSACEEKTETVIKFDKSSSSSKSFYEQTNITKTTEMFIEHEKEHNQYSSVIKAIQSEKYFCNIDDRKILSRSIFSPMPDDGKDNSMSSHSRLTVTNNFTEEKDALSFNVINSIIIDHSDKMDVDNIESCDENQPLDYSVGDATLQKDSRNGSNFENVIPSVSSEDNSIIDGKVSKELGNINCCQGSFSICRNSSHAIENNNSEAVSMKNVNNSSCSSNQPLGVDNILACETKQNLMEEENKDTNLNSENGIVEDIFSSDESNFESDFDISDSEPTNEKEAITEEAINFMDVSPSNEEICSDSHSLRHEQSTTECFNKEKEITLNGTQEINGQSHILKVGLLSPKEPSVIPVVFNKDNPVSESVDQYRKSVYQEGNVSATGSLLLNVYLKDAKNKESNYFKEESLENQNENPRSNSSLKSSEEKVAELLAVTSPYNYHTNEVPISKLRTDERSETSVIVRNNSFTSVINNCKESSSKYYGEIESNVESKCDFSTSTTITLNKEISDIYPIKKENSLSDLKKQSFQEAKPKMRFNNFSEQYKLVTKSSNDESNISDKAYEDESMEIEPPSIQQTSVMPATELSSINTFVASENFEEESNSSKMCYCVSESIFLNIGGEFVPCLEKNSSSYLLDFKKRKLLKFCKSVKHGSNYSEDFSIINFGLNLCQLVCPSQVVTSEVTNTSAEMSRCDIARTETSHKIPEPADETKSAPLTQYEEGNREQFQSHFDPPETLDPIFTDSKNVKIAIAEVKSDHSEKKEDEDSEVLKPNKNTVVFKSKLCLPQEINSFCIRRDSLKLLEPEAVLKEIFSPDPDIEDSESKENYFSTNHTKDKRSSTNSSQKFSLAPITCTTLSSLHNDSSVENKCNTLNSSSQNFSDLNFNLLNPDKDAPLISTNLEVCISDVNSKMEYNAQSKSTIEIDETKSPSKGIEVSDGLKQNICKERLSFIDADVLDEKSSIEDKQNSITSSLEDCNNLDVSCARLIAKNGSESHGYFKESLIHSNHTSLLCPSKSVECCDQTSPPTKSHLHNKHNYEEECSQSKVENIVEHLSQENERTVESLTAPQDVQTLSCQISNLDNNVNHTNNDEKSISSMAIVTGRDVLFSSRFLDDEEDKESNSELQTENRSRKSSVEEESILDCQNMKINSQDSLRGSGHLSSETFPLQCLVDAALALENVDSKQMLLNSSNFSEIYSQSSQSLLKSTIDDVHPNDIEDFSEKHCSLRTNSDSNTSKENKLSAADQEIFSKFEENNYNLRASTKIVTSSSSNIIPYSKRYYKLKGQKRPKRPVEKKNKSDILTKKIQTKKRKDVFTYPRSKRRKKGKKLNYQQLKKQDFLKKSSENNYIQTSSTDGLAQNCDNDLVIADAPGSTNENIEEKEVCFQSCNTHMSAESYNLGSNQLLTAGKSNFGGPLIIANENSPAENNIFCVHVNSDKMDEYVHDLNVGELDLLSEHNQSVFKENSMEEHSETPDITLENGTSLVIIIEELGEPGEKDNYYNTCKGDSDVILGGIEGRSPLPQPNSILDYCSDNLTSEVSINESCICPASFDNEKNCESSLFKDSKSLESESSISYKSYEKYSAECSQELLTTNCYEEINETLVNDIGNWPFVEEEVAEFNTKSVSPNRIPEEGRKIELKCSLPWNKIFNMTKTKKKKNKTSHKVSGLELGPAKVEVRLRAPSTEWKVISDYAENSSPVVKVSRLILQRESETSSYSEKDSEEENENRKLSSPSSIVSECNNNSCSNDVSKNLIEDDSWQPVVLLTRDKELDELTRSKNRYRELDEVTQSRDGDKDLVEFALTLDSQLMSEQSSFTGFSSPNNDVNKDDSGSESSVIVGEEIKVNCNLNEESKFSGNLKNNVEDIETDPFDHFPEEKNVHTRYQNTRTEKGCTYETYSPSRHEGTHADQTIYSPSDPHYSPEPAYPYSDSSSLTDKKQRHASTESDISRDTENYYNSSQQANFGSFNNLNKDTINEGNNIHRAGCFKNSFLSGTAQNVNLQDNETSDTNYSSETQISSLFNGDRNYLTEKILLSHGIVHQVSSQYVRPDLLDTPNIISNETRKIDLRKNVVEENLRKFKRKMPKNFFVRRKSRKNVDHQNDTTNKMLIEEKQEEEKPGSSPLLPDDNNSFPCSTESALSQRRLSSSSVMQSIQNDCQTGQGPALLDERLSSTKSDLSFVCDSPRLPCLDDLKDSYPMRLNDSPMAERFEEKLRLRDGGRGLKRPCEGHSKEDTKRRRKNIRNHSNKCQECDAQFDTKAELSRHTAQSHAATERELHHCLLCQRSFSSSSRHRLHMEGRSHRHLELTQRHTIHTVHRLLSGEDCPLIASLSATELQALQWRPAHPGYSHFYHQLTPLQTVLQEHISEASEETATEAR